jgi:hypothetical protein
MKGIAPVLRRLAKPSRIQRITSRHTSTSTSKSRLERINARLPRFLHRYTTPLAKAPASTITSFLLLHELTAVVPLFALTGFFHYTNYLPPYISEGAWVAAGIERFGRYFRRKGWIRDSPEERALEAAAAEEEENGGDQRTRDRVWNASESGVRVVVEVATAYAITKAFLPLRLMGSVWATPWFARTVMAPLLGVGKRVFRQRKKTVGGAPAAAKTVSSAPQAGTVHGVGIGDKGPKAPS